MRPTLSDIHRRIKAISSSSTTPFVVFVTPVYDGDDTTDQAVYATIEEALTAFSRAHRITLDDTSIIFINDIPGISEDEERAGIVGYTLEN